MSHFYNSAIYEGVVSHCRFKPFKHKFNYKVMMVYLELSELEQVFSLSPFWSLNRWNLARFKRQDYIAQDNSNLDLHLRTLVKKEIGKALNGKICVLTNLRWFGYLINPITCYYCFDESDALAAIVVEVTNTPWKERQTYVLSNKDGSKRLNCQFKKSMHVSPFLPMDMQYIWRSNTPDKRLKIYMENHQLSKKVFSASLHLRRKEINAKVLNTVLINYPFMTIRVIAGIYWQALKLWFKGASFFSNPSNKKHSSKIESI